MGHCSPFYLTCSWCLTNLCQMTRWKDSQWPTVIFLLWKHMLFRLPLGCMLLFTLCVSLVSLCRVSHCLHIGNNPVKCHSHGWDSYSSQLMQCFACALFVNEWDKERKRYVLGNVSPSDLSLSAEHSVDGRAGVMVKAGYQRWRER